MKIIYITAYTPWGRGETFVLDEMLAMQEIGAELLIVPRNTPGEIFHKEAQHLLDRAVLLPLLNWRIFFSFLRAILLKPRLWMVLKDVVQHSRWLRILLKNLAVVPKAVFVATLLKKEDSNHIHVHWGSTTATMAWVISALTGIPWSFTIHRWDIAENNMLKFKVECAEFARCISKVGRCEVLSIVGEVLQEKVKVLHLGVPVPDMLSIRPCQSLPDFVIACPANFLPVKGHRFLIEACALLLKDGIRNFRCLLIGEGPLEAEIRRQVVKLGLEEVIKLCGQFPHDELMGIYEHGEVDTVVLPSILTQEGEKEGIPVVLMEAMAYEIPVISTDTGGIPELLSDGAGVMVPEKDAKRLADALKKLIQDKELATKLGKNGCCKVDMEFNLGKNAERLLEMMKKSYKQLNAHF